MSRTEPGSARRPAGPTRRETVEGIARELSEHGIEASRHEAERLVAAALGVPRRELTTEAGERLDPDEAREVARAVARRVTREPLQHIEGTTEFRELVLVSDRRALVPRPETEELVDLVAGRVDNQPVARALDVGVGSGALALSLLVERIADRVVGIDVSADALEQARENAAREGVEDRLELRRCGPDIWDAVREEPAFDLLVSNPPYIASEDLEGLEPEVRDHDPRSALDGGSDGLDVIRRLVAGAPGALRPGGRLFMEIGAGQGEAVRGLLEDAGPFSEIAIEPDLSGRPRFARARLKGRDAGAGRVAP